MSNLTKSEILVLKKFVLFVLYHFEDMKIFSLFSFSHHFFPRFFCKVCRLQKLLRSLEKYFLRTNLFIHAWSVLFIRIGRSENLKYFLSEGIDPCFTEALAGIESAENPLLS